MSQQVTVSNDRFKATFGLWGDRTHDDKPVYRFRCYRLEDSDWLELSEATFATLMPEGDYVKLLEIAADRVLAILDEYDADDRNPELVLQLELLSWMSPDTLKGFQPESNELRGTVHGQDAERTSSEEALLEMSEGFCIR